MPRDPNSLPEVLTMLSSVIKGFGKSLCPSCGWTNLHVDKEGLYCSACGWLGETAETNAPEYVRDLLQNVSKISDEE